MVYHSVQIGPTEAQMSSLAAGDATHIPSNNILGDVSFHLTTAQLKKLEKAHASGKGCLIKLSPAQVKHMAQHGSGRFTDMLKAGYNMMKPALRAGLHHGLEYGAHRAEDAIARRAGLNGSGFFGDILKGAAHGAVDIAANALGGSVKVHKSHARKQKGGWIGSDIFGGCVMPRKQAGKGFFGDILKGAAHGAIDVGAHALGAGVNPRSNPNEGLRSALFQKKAVSGGGLYQ